MSCSARLPVYTLLIGAFIPGTTLLSLGGWTVLNLQGVTLISMYLIGLVVAPLVAWTLKRTVLRGPTPAFLMELPSYKWPSLETVAWRMAEQGWAFLRRAGTLILATSIVIWALQYYPRPASVAESFASEQKLLEEERSSPGADTAAIDESLADIEHRMEAAYQEQSFLGRMGKAIEPAVRPLGWDWRIGMAAIASFPAREVVVAALGTIYSVGSDVDLDDESGGRLKTSLQQATWPDGRPVFTIPVALSVLVFFALCCQCAATLVIIRKETNSWTWPTLTFAYMTTLAYVAALIVYQVGSRIGGS
jgi:ferrous iron transport protein B